MNNISEILVDFPSGPLDFYRKSASFNWKDMRLFLEGEDRILFKNNIYTTLECDPLFARSSNLLDLESSRNVNFMRLKRIMDYNWSSFFEYFEYPYRFIDFMNAIGIYDWALSTKRSINQELFGTACFAVGSEEHQQYFSQIQDFDIVGCFALTEMSHGSNAKAIQTTATYDLRTEEFVLHTPCIDAIKLWVGNLAKTATHAIVFAKLIDASGTDHGVNMFAIQIRSKKDFRPLPGITIGDMGAKIGLNGLDNGFVQFNNFRVSKRSLLNKNGVIDENGLYRLKNKNKSSKRFNTNIGILSIGRIGITGIASTNLKMLMTIAIRYSAFRKQFGPEGVKNEYPILEYQVQQYRLLPYLAATYVITHLSEYLICEMIKFQAEIQSGLIDNIDPEMLLAYQTNMEYRSKEMHAISCAVKSITTWTAQWCAQVCRESCGGHGYLHSSRIGEIRNDNDANCTYEGDNNVILQQTSNYILQMYNQIQTGITSNSSNATVFPYKTMDFLFYINQNSNLKFQSGSVNVLIDSREWVQAMDWLLSVLVLESIKRVEQLNGSSLNNFDVRNNSQVFYCRDVAIVYAKRILIQKFDAFVHSKGIRNDLAIVLKRLSALYSLWIMEQYLGTFYQYGYMKGPQSGSLIKQAILTLCSQLKPDAVSLVDSFGIPDFMLNSTLGVSDGKVYEHIYSKMLETKNVFERPEYWQKFLDRSHLNEKLKSKL